MKTNYYVNVETMDEEFSIGPIPNHDDANSIMDSLPANVLGRNVGTQPIFELRGM